MWEGGVIQELKNHLLRHCDGLRAVEGCLAAAHLIDPVTLYQASPGQVNRPDGKALMVVSATSGEGRTIATACLGWSLSAAARTLLIDADLRNPELGKLFGVPPNPGLVNVMLDGLDIEEAVRPTETDNLGILPCGRDATDYSGAFPPPQLRGDAFAQFLAGLRQRWDYVVFDTPPLLAESDALLMARQVDGAVFVLAAGRTDWEVARDATARLAGAGGRLIGAVLNRRRTYVPRALS